MDDRDIKFKLDPPAVIALIIVFVVSAALLASFTGGHGLSKLIIVVIFSIILAFIVSLIVQYIYDSSICAKMEKQASMYGFVEDEESDDGIQDSQEINQQYEEERTENFMDKYQSLEKLAELKEKGILSEEEFTAEKAKVLNGTSFVQPRSAPKAESQEYQPIIINNSNSNFNTAYSTMNAKNKWVALLLCIFLGVIGAHKFYEGKILLGIVYLCTLGLFGIGVFVDFFAILFKPNPYYC